jgi:hypothetical protein
MKIWKLLIGIFLINVATAGTGGSNFSRYGLGDLQYLRGSYSIGMAGTAISLLTPVDANRLNPAGWTVIDRTRFSIDAYYQSYSIKSGADKNFLSGILLEGFDMSIPLVSKYGIVLGAGLHPYSKVDYNILLNESASDYAYDLSYKGDGGLSIAHLGISANIFSDFHIGAKFNYLFGNINHTIKQTITSGVASGFEVDRSARIYGLNGTFGLIYSGLGKTLKMPASSSLSVGFLVTTGSNLTAKQERDYRFYNGSNLLVGDTTQINEGKIKIPLAIGFGLSTIQNNRYQVAVDYYIQNWGESKFFDESPKEIRNSKRFSAGVGIIPEKDAKASMWQKVGFRLGFFYNQSYYQIKNEKINEIGFTAGTDFSIYGDTRLSVGLEYTTRGVTSLQQDKIFRISLGLDMAELWFVRSEED